MKSRLMKATTLICAFMLAVLSFTACSSDKGNAVMEYKDPSGKVMSSVDQSFLSFVIAIINYQHGADSLTDASVWDMSVSEGSDTTVRDLIRTEAVSYAKALLQAEYLSDYVYGIGFSDEQEDSLDSAIESMSASMGGQKAFEAFLSTYGTNVASVRRFMLLQTKYSTLQTALYTKGSGMDITDAEVKNFFAENYMIADYICILLTGGVKDDGTSIPLSSQEIEEKKALAKNVVNQLQSGAIEFKTAMETYSDADYSSVYPDGYFIPVNGTAQGLNDFVSDAVREMETDEIRSVETSNAIYIINKRPMNAELYNSKEGFADALRSALSSEDFMKQLETADGIVLYQDAINALDPAVIPAFNVDAMGS